MRPRDGTCMIAGVNRSRTSDALPVIPSRHRMLRVLAAWMIEPLVGTRAVHEFLKSWVPDR